MQTKPLFAALVAAAFAFPLAANAGGADKHAADKPAKSASASGSNDGGAEAMFKSMDKNGDGFISKEEAAGTPHAADFASLDKNGDGKLSREEHSNAKEHVAAREKAGSTGSTAATSPGQPSGKTY
jgi:hypothetical protein